jgi:hypothetical protein
MQGTAIKNSGSVADTQKMSVQSVKEPKGARTSRPFVRPAPLAARGQTKGVGTGSNPAATPRRRRDDKDTLARFQRPLVWFRWLVYGLSFAASILSGTETANRTALIALLIWTCIRTLEPIKLTRSRLRTTLPLLIEFGVAGGVVVSSGGWSSPNTLMLLPPLLVIASISGTVTAMVVSLATGAVITSTMTNNGVLLASDVETGVRWTGIMMLVTLLV